MDLNRFIVLYIGFTSIGIFFGFIGYSILRRDPKDRLNQFLSAFYFLGLLSFIVNIIYATVNNSASQDFINFLGVLTIYFLMLSVVFLLMFTQLLYKPRKLIKTKNQFLILIVYASILSIMFLIPDGIIIKIQSDGTQLSPVWNLPFTFFIIIILSLSASYIFIISYKIYKRFKYIYYKTVSYVFSIINNFWDFLLILWYRSTTKLTVKH